MPDLDALQAAAEAATPGPWLTGLARFEYDHDETHYVAPKIGPRNICQVYSELAPHDAAFIAAANPAVILEWAAAHRAALSRIARVEVLHTPRSIQVLTGDCALGECEHEETNECPTTPFDQCVACDEMADTLNTYYVEEHGFVTAWPCPTVRALTEGENE